MKKILILILSCIITFSCSKDEDASSSNTGTLKYEVVASKGELFVTHISDGITSQDDISSSSWSNSFEARIGDPVYLQALAKTTDVNLKVKIYWKGNLFRSDETLGDFPQLVIKGNLN